MTTPTSKPAPTAEAAQSDHPEDDTYSRPEEYKPLTTKLREAVGVHTDTDIALLQNDAFWTGLTVIGVGINPAAGFAIGAYTVARSVRDRSRVKQAANEARIARWEARQALRQAQADGNA